MRISKRPPTLAMPPAPSQLQVGLGKALWTAAVPLVSFRMLEHGALALASARLPPALYACLACSLPLWQPGACRTRPYHWPPAATMPHRAASLPCLPPFPPLSSLPSPLSPSFYPQASLTYRILVWISPVLLWAAMKYFNVRGRWEGG